jgi:hypothetical protein
MAPAIADRLGLVKAQLRSRGRLKADFDLMIAATPVGRVSQPLREKILSLEYLGYLAYPTPEARSDLVLEGVSAVQIGSVSGLREVDGDDLVEEQTERGHPRSGCLPGPNVLEDIG